MPIASLALLNLKLGLEIDRIEVYTKAVTRSRCTAYPGTCQWTNESQINEAPMRLFGLEPLELFPNLPATP
jgi:hypothetical protein